MIRRLPLLILALQFSSGLAVAQPAASTASAPMTLPQALQYALEHYPGIRAAIEDINASTSGVSAAKAAYLPRFDSVWQTNRATANNIFGQLFPQSVLPSLSGPVLPDASSQSVWGSAVGGLLSWEAFDFGARDATVKQAEAGVQRMRAEQALTVLGVQQAVGSAFLTMAVAQRAVVAAEADVARRQTLARATQTLVDNQLRPGAEASRSAAEQAASETRLIQARQSLAIARAMLGRLLGVTSGSIAINADALANLSGADDSRGTSETMHPVLQSAQAAVDLAQSRESVVASAFRPHVYLESSVFARGSGANPDGTFNGGGDGLWPERANWAAGIQVVLPNAFDIVGVRARSAAAAAETRAQRARLDEAALNLRAQQEEADAAIEAARAIARNTPLQLTAARQSESQARARYDAGLASIVEVAEAQSLLAQAEYQDAAAQIDVWRALLARAVAAGDLTPFVDRLRAAGVQ